MMKKYVIASHLPEKAADKLGGLGFETIGFSGNENVGREISYHADISFFSFSSTLFLAREMEPMKEKFEKICKEVIVISEKSGKKYPEDVKLNCVFAANRLICNIDTVSADVLYFIRKQGVKILPVRQGYARCSVLPVGKNSLITDDPSIFSTCKKENIDALFVEKGSVRLPGCEYGFIGGASALLNDNLVCFVGNLDYHSDSGRIKRFLLEHGVDFVCLGDKELTDIGSLIVLGQDT